MAENEDSDHLRDLEQRAADTKAAQDEGTEPQAAEETDEHAEPAAPGEEGSGNEYGVENDMRPGGPAAGEADSDGPKKRIDEDVTGDEESEHMSELHTDD